MHILDAPRLKLRWAEKHLQALNDAVNAFFENNPVRIISNKNAEQGQQILRMEFAPYGFPLDFSILAGYVVHDMRSSLDWLICALCEYHGATDLIGIEFPIFRKRPAKWKKRRHGSEDSFEYKIRYLPREVKEAINLLQPYYTEERYGYSAEAQMLWKLHQLDITDKHRRLIVRASMAGINMPNHLLAQSLFKGLNDDTIEIIMPIQDNDFDPKPSIDIAFRADALPDPVDLGSLWRIHNFVGDGIFPMLTAHLSQ